MCHVPCAMWPACQGFGRLSPPLIAISHIVFVSCATGLSCTELNWTKLSWAPPWRTILYKYLRLTPSLLNRLPRPAHSFEECHCECHTNCSLWTPSCLILLCPACCPLLYRPCRGIMCTICMYCIYTWAAKRAPKVDINNKWESEGTTCLAACSTIEYALHSTG